MSGEFDIIARHFAPLAKDLPGAFGLKDDAAIIQPPKGHALVVTADAIVEGVHFLPGDPPAQIAQKLLRVNLSDIAAKGATPLAYVLTCAFPRAADEVWISSFTKGLKADQSRFGISLLGGDTVSTPGPATFSATMFGAASRGRMLRRNGAKRGDLLCVSGTIGDAGLGLDELRTPHSGLSLAHHRHLVGRYRIPQPRTDLGPFLKELGASAALDVSDGLVQDLGHLATQSGVRVVMELDAVPLSAAARALERRDPDIRKRLISVGDDYEIAFTLRPSLLSALETGARRLRTPVHVIGRIEKGEGVVIKAPDGTPIEPRVGGYDHFR